MRKNYGKPVVKKLKKEGLKRAGDDDSRLEGFRGNDRVRVEFADHGSVLVHRRRKRSGPSVFPSRGGSSVTRLKKTYSPEKLAETLEKNGIEWLGFDEKDILRAVYDDSYPGRKNSPADALVYLRPENRALVRKSEGNYIHRLDRRGGIK